MQATTYKPSMPMVRELARAGCGEASAEALALATCQRRGLITWRGELSEFGQMVLQDAVDQMHASEREARAYRVPQQAGGRARG